MTEVSASEIDRNPKPYTPAWPHLVTRAIHRLPWPPIVTYAAIAILATLGLSLRPWVAGRLPVGALDANSLTFGVNIAVLLYFFRYLEQAANVAFARFRPALVGEANPDAIRLELAVLPAWIGALTLGASVALTIVTFVFDPESSGVDGLPGWVVAIAFVLQVLNVGALFALVAQMVRQMRAIRRVLQEDAVVDIYRPAPLHALSGLSARMGVGLVLLTGAITLIVGPNQGPSGPVGVDALFALTLAPYLVLPVVIAALTFVVPLVGTHGRLVDEKARLESASDERLQKLMTELSEGVDARRFADLDPLNKALGAVIQQREIIRQLSTWPWSAGSARALATAIFLPLALFVTQRLLSGVLGLH